MTESAPRVWGGTTLDTRRDTRRRRLLEVGFELLGGQGSAAVTVRSVCRHAKLTDRYFYENFADRDGLLVAVYQQVAEQFRDAMAVAVGTAVAEAAPGPVAPEAVARSAVLAFVGLLTGDPRKGRVLLLAPMTDAALSAHAVGLMPMFGELIRVQLAEAPGGAQTTAALDERMTATALIGALSNLFVRWLDGTLEASEQELTDYCVRLLLTAAPLARPIP
ncbi:TetR/AcrR family transcriptional regulator [Pseudonocardia sp. Cha107L01]|jgi:AcrR family transcriptional regulator|uniref:TetR/AcrR family transcriptional regulator n=1 Tax=Pseudonocardia sp. Cha107L01 TaxID=3457576 RepID=UPI00403EC287